MSRCLKISASLSLLIAFSLTLCSSAAAVPAGLKVTQISSPAPYQFYDFAALNESGQVCYHAATSGSAAILKGDGISNEVVASSDDASGLFERFFSRFCSINDQGDVAFDACTNCAALEPQTQPLQQPAEGPVHSGVYVKSSGIIKVIAESGASNNFQFVSIPTISNSGVVSFAATLTSGLNGIFLRNGAALQTIFDSSGVFAEVGGVHINNSLQAAFAAKELVNPLSTAIYGPTGAKLLGGTSEFSTFSLPVINNLGKIAVMGSTTPSSSTAQVQSGVYVDGVPFVLNTGDFTRVDISSFQALSINDQGDVVFPAFRPNGRSVVFLAVQGGMIPIIETGDTLPGQSSPVQLATVSRESINNARQIALTVRLQNETELVIRLDPDGIVFPDDQCPTDNTKFEAGICGCGVSDADSNTDGLLDCLVTPRLYQLTDELNKQMRKLRRLASSAPKKAKKKQRQLIRGINQGLREALYLADTSAGQIKLKSVNISALKLAKKMRSAVKKGLKTSNSDFGRNKSKAMKAIRKFRNSLLIS